MSAKKLNAKRTARAVKRATTRKPTRAKRIADAVFNQAREKIEELRRERDRARGTLTRIADSVDVVVASLALPESLKAGMEAIAAEAREGAK